MHFMLPNTCMTLLRVDEAQNAASAASAKSKDRSPKKEGKTFSDYLDEFNITDNLLSDLLQSG